jgi:hypothetical protein
MKLLTKPWFAVVVLLAAVAVWIFTVGPWGPWQTRTVATSRLDLRDQTYRRRASTSPAFALHGGPATIRIAAAAAQSTSPTGVTLIADVRWSFIPTRSGETRSLGDDEGLMSPALDTGPVELSAPLDPNPRGAFRMRVSAISNAPATITTTITELRGYWHDVSVIWIILVAGAAYIGLNVMLKRRQYPPNPVVILPRRDQQ